MTSAAATNQIEDAARLDDDPAWPRAAGLRYLRMLYRMHGALAPDWYLEVGTATGKSLKLANCNAIAIDPAFNLKEDVLRGRRQTHMFQETSDAFFASGVARHLAPRIDLAFLDGMHLFEFLVRDFMQTEALCGRDSVITMHDVVPITPVAAERTWDKTRTGAWTGDVWKIVPILRRYRPDLDLRVADCAPSGLAIVTNLDPGNTVLADNYDRIVAEYRDMSLADFGVARLAESLDLEPAEGPALARFAGGQVESPAVRPARSFALKVQAPNTARAPFWGEFHLASGLASAFRRLGIEAEVQTLDRWNRTRPGQADLALWGLKQPFEHAANRWSGVWLLYGANRSEEENLSRPVMSLSPRAKLHRPLRRPIPRPRSRLFCRLSTQTACRRMGQSSRPAFFIRQTESARDCGRPLATQSHTVSRSTSMVSVGTVRRSRTGSAA